MAGCEHFVGLWEIIAVDSYDEELGHLIEISQIQGDQFDVQCRSHPKSYPNATCVDGALKGSGYTIIFIAEAPKNKIHFTADPLASGSWTAEDYRQP